RADGARDADAEGAAERDDHPARARAGARRRVARGRGRRPARSAAASRRGIAESRMSETLFELRGVSRNYRRGDSVVHAVDGIDLTVGAGEFIALEGPSGSGKSTLLQLLGALDRPDGGEIFFEGRPLHTLGDGALAELRLNAFGFVFQQFNLIQTLTALENVEAALAPHGLRGASLHARAHNLLDEVGLAARETHLPVHLSGGEQQ